MANKEKVETRLQDVEQVQPLPGLEEPKQEEAPQLSERQIASIGSPEAPKGQYEIAQRFRDITDFEKVYEVGEEAKFAPRRLMELLEAGLVRKKAQE